MQKFKSIIATLFILSFSCSNANAVDMKDALELAYNKSKELKIAQQKFLSDIQVLSDAVSGFLPNVSVNFEAGESKQTIDSKFVNNQPPATKTKSLRRTLSIQQSIFNGGASVAKLKIAQESFRNYRNELLLEEQKILAKAIDVYLSTYSANEVNNIVAVRVDFNQRQLGAARARYKLGEATITDVEQAKAALARARAEMVDATVSKVKTSEAFERVFGIKPDNLTWPSELASLPDGFERYYELLEKNNFELHSAMNSIKAAKANVLAAKGSLLPQVTFAANLSKNFYDPESNVQNNQKINSRNFDTVLSLKIPIYERGGAEHTAVRKANIGARRAKFAAELVKEELKVQAVDFWQTYESLKSRIEFLDQAVVAQSKVLDNIQHEYKVGLKTVIDVLKEESELSRTQVETISAKKESVSMHYKILSSIGMATSKALGLEVKHFNPDKEAKKVKATIFGF